MAGEQKLLRRVVLYEFGAIGTPDDPRHIIFRTQVVFGKIFEEAPPPPEAMHKGVESVSAHHH